MKDKEKDIIINNDKPQKPDIDVFLVYIPYIIIILVVIMLRSFIATPVRVNGTSMESTLYNGETMLLNKIGLKTKGINRWDIIVVKTGDTFLIKRVVGLPGEKIQYTDDKLYINNKEIKDKYSSTPTENFNQVSLKENEYFVMGDNRSVSQDSRMIGPIKETEVKGKTNLIIFPLDRFGIIK